MDLDKAIICKLLSENDLSSVTDSITPDMLLDDGPKALGFVTEFFGKHGTMPTLETVEAFVGESLEVECLEPMGFYIDLVKKRWLGNKINNGIIESGEALDNRDVDRALAAIQETVAAVTSRGIGGERVYVTDDATAPVRTYSWHTVTDDDVRRAIAGTPVEAMERAFAMPATPCLPLQLSLPPALVMCGAMMVRDTVGYDPDDPLDPDATGDDPQAPRGSERLALRIRGGGCGQATNLYCLRIARSGAGKDIGSILPTLSFRQRRWVGNAASAEGLLERLTHVPNGILYVGEFQKFLEKGCWEAGAIPALVTLWNSGSVSQTFSRGRRRNVPFAYPSLLCNIQPAVWADMMTARNIDNGFLGRMLVTYCDDRTAARARMDYETDYDELVSLLNRYGRLNGEVVFDQGYNEGFFAELSAAYETGDLYDGATRLANEILPRLAVILAADTTVTAEYVERAAVLVRWFLRQQITAWEEVQGALNNSREERFERCIQLIHGKVRELIRKRVPATLGEISRSRNWGHGMDSKMRRAALEELVSRGLLKASTDGGSAPVYRPT